MFSFLEEILARFGLTSLRGRSDSPHRGDQALEPDANEHERQELTTKNQQLIELLAGNDGLLRQRDIVAETEWSEATVSRTLSTMEANGTIRKTPIGRQNIITLVGEEPDWFTYPPEQSE